MINKCKNFFFIFLLLFNFAYPFFSFSKEFSRIPIRSFPFLNNQRFMEIQIEGRTYLGLIDTGSNLSLLRKDILSQVSRKTYISDSAHISINGNQYITPNFKIPGVEIGNFSTAIIFKEEDPHFWTQGSNIGIQSLIQSWKIYLMYQVYREALIGMDLFQQFACVFDFPHSSIFLAKDMCELIEDNEFTFLPLEVRKNGVVLTLNTSLGSKRFLLDSASTTSLLRLSKKEKDFKGVQQGFITEKLIVDQCDLGEWDFRIFDFPNDWDEIDGILGVDFFKKNIIGFDFQNQTICIYSPKLGSKERFTYWLKSYLGN